ncbi:DUF4177 domain-containing protein [Bacillus sinesaloumensis]|uniref:DUF4177 domain-containing protein n=1 Tax=Litchfieldia sinesaloumensis TaxID=1926280 RepID=UPI0009884875|nr:DUF4177 domain-containing protein [Bacillus sinesaloumensis]
MKQFEYKVEEIQVQMLDFKEVLADKLNELGKEGWELSGVNGTYYMFKREIFT